MTTTKTTWSGKQITLVPFFGLKVGDVILDSSEMRRWVDGQPVEDPWNATYCGTITKITDSDEQRRIDVAWHKWQDQDMPGFEQHPLDKDAKVWKVEPK